MKRSSCLRILIILFLLKFNLIFPANSGEIWKHYQYQDIFYCLAFEGNSIWSGSPIGIVRWNKDSGGYEKFTSADGLANGKVISISVDSKGQKWFGTDGFGVSQFDGVSWKTYTTSDGLVHNYVNAIAVDSSGNIWFGTEGGLSKYDGKNWKSYTKANGLADNPIYSLCVNKKGEVWCGTKNAVNVFSGNRWLTYPFPGKSGSDNSILSIAEDQKGYIWIGSSSRGVFRYNQPTWTNFNSDNSDLGSDYIPSLTVDKNNHIWISRGNCWFYDFDGKRWNLHLIRFDSYDEDVFAIAAGSDNNIWMGTIEGLKKYDGNNTSTFKTCEGIPNNEVDELYVDKKGNIWFGTAAGFAKFDGKQWTQYSEADGLPDNFGNAIFVDDASVVWFGTEGGVASLNGNIWKTKLRTFSVDDIICDHSGNLWFASSGGVARFNGTSWIDYEFINTMSNNDVKAAVVDIKNKIWFCALDGLRMFDGKSWFKYSIADGLPDSSFLSATVDHQGNKWFGTQSGGVVKYDDHAWTIYNKDDGVVSNSIGAIAVDKEGNLWVGAARDYSQDPPETNLCKFDGSTWTKYSLPGLGSINIIAIDSSGNKWFGTWNGAYKLITEMPTAVQIQTAALTENILFQNVPNPFNATTRINYHVKKREKIKVAIYNISGQLIKILVQGRQPPGDYVIQWDGKNSRGNYVASGLYLCCFQAGNIVQTKKMTFLK